MGHDAIAVPGPGPEARVAHNQVIGAVGGSGTAVCFGAYDAAFAGLGSDCQTP